MPSTGGRWRHFRLLATARLRPALSLWSLGFVRVPYNNLEAVREIAEHNKTVVAVMLEIVQGEGGIHGVDIAYQRALRELW